jgi:cyanate permease
MLTARRAAFALLIHQWFPAREFVLANGVVNLLFGVTLALGYFATPLILDAAGGSWRSTLYVFGVVSAAGTAVWFIFGRERAAPPKPSEEEKRDRERNVLWAVLRYKELWFCALGFLGAQTAWAAFANFLPTLMLDYDVSLGWSGNLLAINAFMSAVSGLFIGWLISKWNITGAVIVLCGVVLTATLSGMVLTGSLPLLLLADIVNGAAWGFWPVLMSLPFQLKGIKPREIAVALAFFDTSLLLAGTIGPALAGLLQEVTGELRTALVITGVLALALSIAGLLLTAGRSLPSRQTAVGGD